MSSLLIVAHGKEPNDNRKPVEIVGDDATVRRRVCPTEQRVEDAPSATAIDLRVAALKVLETRRVMMEVSRLR